MNKQCERDFIKDVIRQDAENRIIERNLFKKGSKKILNATGIYEIKLQQSKNIILDKRMFLGYDTYFFIDKDKEQLKELTKGIEASKYVDYAYFRTNKDTITCYITFSELGETISKMAGNEMIVNELNKIKEWKNGK